MVYGLVVYSSTTAQCPKIAAASTAANANAATAGLAGARTLHHAEAGRVVAAVLNGHPQAVLPGKAQRRAHALRAPRQDDQRRLLLVPATTPGPPATRHQSLRSSEIPLPLRVFQGVAADGERGNGGGGGQYSKGKRGRTGLALNTAMVSEKLGSPGHSTSPATSCRSLARTGAGVGSREK